MSNTDSQINNLRDSLNRWNQNRTTSPDNTNNSTTNKIGSFFTSFKDQLNDQLNDTYERLPISRQDILGESQEPSWYSLSRWERISLFVCFILGSIACFTICIFLFPVLALNPRKFALLWTMGSLLFILAFGIYMGPVAYIKHISSKDRLPFTIFFFGSCLLTIYSAAFLRSTILTIIAAALELISVLYYTISYFPMGAAGLRYLSSFGISSARGALSI